VTGIAPRENHVDAHRVAYPGLPESCASILLIGEDNPSSDKPEHALFPHPPRCAGSRLQETIMGVSLKTYLGLWRTNLCQGKWNASKARTRAAKIVATDMPWSVIVLLGRKVSDSLDFDNPLFTVQLVHDGRVKLISLPHPSGRNRTWNDAYNITRARSMLMDAVPDVPWGELNDDDDDDE
jgi:hypothetical protein